MHFVSSEISTSCQLKTGFFMFHLITFSGSLLNLSLHKISAAVNAMLFLEAHVDLLCI